MKYSSILWSLAFLAAAGLLVTTIIRENQYALSKQQAAASEDRNTPSTDILALADSSDTEPVAAREGLHNLLQPTQEQAIAEIMKIRAEQGLSPVDHAFQLEPVSAEQSAQEKVVPASTDELFLENLQQVVRPVATRQKSSHDRASSPDARADAEAARPDSPPDADSAVLRRAAQQLEAMASRLGEAGFEERAGQLRRLSAEYRSESGKGGTLKQPVD